MHCGKPGERAECEKTQANIRIYVDDDQNVNQKAKLKRLISMTARQERQRNIIFKDIRCPRLREHRLGRDCGGDERRGRRIKTIYLEVGFCSSKPLCDLKRQ